MPVPKQVIEEPDAQILRRMSLDERFLNRFVAEDPLDRVEAGELRQIFIRALEQLSAEELKVIELRYQHKVSPGRACHLLGIGREELKRLEESGIGKLRKPLEDYMEP